MKCVGFERLIDYLDNRLAGEEREKVQTHLVAGCSTCQAARGWYERVRQVMASDKTIEPPPWVLRRAARLIEARRPAERGIRRAARGIARLIFDSLRQPATAGARSAGSGERQLLYSVDDYSIDLQIAPSGESRANLIGQVLSTGEAGFDSVARVSVDLARKGKRVHSTKTDEVGVFVINKLAPGKYDLRIDARDMTVTLVGLPVSPRL